MARQTTPEDKRRGESPTSDTAEDRQAEVLKRGRFSTALETDDNAVDASNTAYVGVSEEYRNHAYDDLKPLRSEDEEEAKREQVGIDHEQEMRELAEKVNPRTGYVLDDLVHPSERKKPQDAYIEGNRALMDKAVADARGGSNTQGGNTSRSDSDLPPA